MPRTAIKKTKVSPTVWYEFRMVSVVPYLATLNIHLVQGKKDILIHVDICDVITTPDICIHLRSLPEDEYYSHQIYRRLIYKRLKGVDLRQYIIDGLKSVDLKFTVLGTTRPLKVSAVEFLNTYV